MPIVLIIGGRPSNICLFVQCSLLLHTGPLTTMEAPSRLMEPSLSLSVLSQPSLSLCTACVFVCVCIIIMYKLYYM